MKKALEPTPEPEREPQPDMLNMLTALAAIGIIYKLHPRNPNYETRGLSTDELQALAEKFPTVEDLQKFIVEGLQKMYNLEFKDPQNPAIYVSEDFLSIPIIRIYLRYSGENAHYVNFLDIIRILSKDENSRKIAIKLGELRKTMLGSTMNDKTYVRIVCDSVYAEVMGNRVTEDEHEDPNSDHSLEDLNKPRDADADLHLPSITEDRPVDSYLTDEDNENITKLSALLTECDIQFTIATLQENGNTYLHINIENIEGDIDTSILLTNKYRINIFFTPRILNDVVELLQLIVNCVNESNKKISVLTALGIIENEIISATDFMYRTIAIGIEGGRQSYYRKSEDPDYVFADGSTKKIGDGNTDTDAHVDDELLIGLLPEIYSKTLKLLDLDDDEAGIIGLYCTRIEIYREGEPPRVFIQSATFSPTCPFRRTRTKLV